MIESTNQIRPVFLLFTKVIAFLCLINEPVKVVNLSLKLFKNSILNGTSK